MANQLYPKFKEALLSAGLNLSTDTIKVALVDTGLYTYSGNDQYLSAVSSAIVGAPQALASKAIALGVFDAADVTFPTVSGASVEALVIYKDTGNAASSPLIAYMDSATGLPVQPNGGDINIAWSNGASKIFAL